MAVGGKKRLWLEGKHPHGFRKKRSWLEGKTPGCFKKKRAWLEGKTPRGFKKKRSWLEAKNPRCLKEKMSWFNSPAWSAAGASMSDEDMSWGEQAQIAVQQEASTAPKGPPVNPQSISRRAATSNFMRSLHQQEDSRWSGRGAGPPQTFLGASLVRQHRRGFAGMHSCHAVPAMGEGGGSDGPEQGSQQAARLAPEHGSGQGDGGHFSSVVFPCYSSSNRLHAQQRMVDSEWHGGLSGSGATSSRGARLQSMYHNSAGMPSGRRGDHDGNCLVHSSSGVSTSSGCGRRHNQRCSGFNGKVQNPRLVTSQLAQGSRFLVWAEPDGQLDAGLSQVNVGYDGAGDACGCSGRCALQHEQHNSDRSFLSVQYAQMLHSRVMPAPQDRGWQKVAVCTMRGSSTVCCKAACTFSARWHWKPLLAVSSQRSYPCKSLASAVGKLKMQAMQRQSVLAPLC